MSASDETISVIIPSARPDKVIDTINGLLSQTFTAQIIEILVVSPEHNSRIAELSKKSKVTIVTVEELYPPGKMRNVGARTAVGKYLAFIDDDCIPEDMWLEKLLEEISMYPDVGMIGCRLVSGNKGFWSVNADYSLFAAYQYHKKMFIDLGSAAIVVKRQAFAATDGFDESLSASEDWDFSLRLRQEGWRCLFTPEVEVVHFHGRESFVDIVKNAYFSGQRSGLIVQKRYYSKMSWLAKISVYMGTPLLYCLLILPYATALTMAQGIGLMRSDWKRCLHVPIIFICRLLYHCGVWRRLVQDSVLHRGERGGQ
ncbi:MAG: glycosyltransferase [Proteobacteria bacterium]|nr:glycosyltransferase [Pseudomonadota bacterium]